MEHVGPNKEYAIDTNKEIGRGNYGRVYECYSQQTQLQQGNLCAKVIAIYSDNKKQLSEKELDREKQITEIVKNNQQNKNLVKVYYVEHNKQKSVLTVVMEKCISSLEQEWKKKNIYSETEIIDFLKQFANGYKALHDQNIIHRDIKPENILIQQEGTIKYYRLADFGIGRIYKLNDFKFTKSGTPVFASPELNSLILDNELDQNFALMKKKKDVVDMYSLGIILHMLMLGGYPYELTSISVKKFLTDLKSNPFKLKSHPNIRLANLVEKMIVYDPSKRLKFEELTEEINRLSNILNPVFSQFSQFQSSNPGSNNAYVVNPQQGQMNPFQKQFQSQNPQGGLTQQANLQQRFTKPTSLKNSQSYNFINPQKMIVLYDEICKFLKRCVLIHKNSLNPEHLSTIERYIAGQQSLINEIVKLYNNFDKNYLYYNEEEINFYFCLKYAQFQKISIPYKSKDEQLAELRA